jgi:hypothetical protein
LTATQINAIEGLFIAVEKSTAPVLFSQVLNCAPPACTVTSNTTATINVAAPCPDSGTVNITAMLTAVMAGASVSTSTTGPIGFSNCSGGGVQLQGSLLEGAQVQVTNLEVVNPSPFTITGSTTFVVNGVTGSISFNCTNSLTFVSVTPLKTVVSASGNATLQYPVGQNTTTAPCAAFNGFSM